MQPLNTFLSNFLPRTPGPTRLVNSLLQILLPSPLKQHVWATAAEGTTLRLLTDGAQWATRLRFHQRELLKQLNTEPELAFKKIEVRIASQLELSPKTPATERPLEPGARKAIREAAKALSDPELKEIFERLARR
jgi:hypothetical protein